MQLTILNKITSLLLIDTDKSVKYQVNCIGLNLDTRVDKSDEPGHGLFPKSISGL